MDTTDADIEFDEQGVCNHCRKYDELAAKGLSCGAEGERRLQQLVEKVKSDGKGKEYDCIIGLSGGVDSSYLACQAKRLGLRPLAIHMDNGWNSELAVKNIENIVKKLDLDLFTYVLDWEEFRDLQIAFFKASVIDIEMLTDNAITSIVYKIAREKKIKYFLDGQNITTEAIMPKSWVHLKSDLKNIKAIHQRFGMRKIISFPLIALWRKLFYKYSRILQPICLLNYMNYNKPEAISFLEKEVGWKYYGGKHYESIFTKFYQAYVLPVKFNVDKRRAHLSSLICSGQITREQALKEMEIDLYLPEQLKWDQEYVIKKLGFTMEEFEQIMNIPVKSHLDYPSSVPIYEMIVRVAESLHLTW